MKQQFGKPFKHKEERHHIDQKLDKKCPMTLQNIFTKLSISFIDFSVSYLKKYFIAKNLGLKFLDDFYSIHSLKC